MMLRYVDRVLYLQPEKVIAAVGADHEIVHGPWNGAFRANVDLRGCLGIERPPVGFHEGRGAGLAQKLSNLPFGRH